MADVIEKHSHELIALSEDLVTMIEKKYPQLPQEAVLIAIDCKKEFAREIRDTHKDFFSEVRAIRDRDFPGRTEDLVDSIDAHRPGLRQDLRNSLDKEFTGIQKNLKSLAQTKYPNLEHEIRDILK